MSIPHTGSFTAVVLFIIVSPSFVNFVARLERHDFRMKRTEDPVSLAIGSDGSDRNLLISEMSKSVQNSSVRARIPGAPPSFLLAERAR